MTLNNYLFSMLNMNTSDRINERMRHLDLSPSDIMEKTGASRGAVSQWRNDIAKPSGEKLLKLAAALRVSPEWLLTGAGLLVELESNTEPGPRMLGMVPVINEVQAGMWSEIRDTFLDSDALDWVPTLRKLSRWAFGLRIVGDSMFCPGHSKSLSEGEIAIVEPEAQAEHRDVVVARQASSNRATVKQLLIDGDSIILNPLNERYKPIEVTEGVHISGVVMDVVRRFR